MGRVGVVVIGRNEGERLRRCLASLGGDLGVVYVDSGSTDGSAALAKSFGADVVDLDLSTPFTAARARNAGFAKLPDDVAFVQFVDGDCEVDRDWIAAALRAMDDPKVAVVCGRRRERHPEVSIYNRLCDIEWDTPVGEANACGGDALMRASVVRQVGGYDPSVIAAEDDELCLRVRRAGFKVVRIDAEMTLHDAAMTRFGQWWKRAVRCGYAYAQGASLHGRGPERHFVGARRRVIVWAFAIPLMLLALAWPTGGWALMGFLVYPLQASRIAWRNRRRPVSRGTLLAYGASCVGSKFPEFVGVCRFAVTRMRRRPGRIIEYK